MKLRQLACLGAMILLSASCRTTTSELKDIVQAPLPPVIVVMGGFSSCGWVNTTQVNGGAGRTWGNPGNMDMAEVLDGVRSEYSNYYGTSAPQFVVSCYNGKSSSYIYYFSSKNQKLRYTKWNELNPLVAEVNSFRDTHEVFFIGHSYGGWLAMQLANATNAKFKKAVITIDPISPYKCNQVSTTASIITANTSGNGTVGCTTFPRDIGPAATAKISQNYEAWHHYYQTAYRPLHSNVVNNQGAGGDSDIKQGGFGFIVPYASGGTLGGVHTKIDTSEYPWDKLRELLGIGLAPGLAQPQIVGAMPKDTANDSMQPVVESALLPNDDVTQIDEQIPMNAADSDIGGLEGAPAQAQGQESSPRGIAPATPSPEQPAQDANQSFGRL